MMLNYLEQGPLYNAINFSLEGRGSDYREAVRTPRRYNAKISVFLCPSDPNGGGIVNDNCYYGSVGALDQRRRRRPASDHVPPSVSPNFSSPTSGVFGFRLAYGLRDITDGSSNTIAFSEGSAGAASQTVTSGQHDHGRGPVGQSAYFLSAIPEPAISSWRTCKPARTSTSRRTRATSRSATATTGASAAWVPRCSTRSPPQQHHIPVVRLPDRLRRRLRRGEHGLLQRPELPPGRGQRPDGRRERPVPQEYHQHANTYWALGTRNGGEVISSDAY